MPRVHIKTYGCQMNERDSEQVSQMFVERGYTLTRDETDADVILINTCSVRDQAEQKALGKMGLMHRMRRHKPRLLTGFMGCMAQSRGPELVKKSGVDLVVGTQKYHRVVDYVEQIFRAREERQMDEERFSIVDVEEEADSQGTIRDHVLKDQQASAFVSIMQGCNMKCTFCIVPYTRGAERSRPIAEIVGEVRHLAARGVKEVTLLGQIVNLFGRHEFAEQDGKSPFVQLLEAVHEVDGIERIRFTSPHPIGYKADLINAFTRLPKLAEHVHLPMQSGSDAILKRMHRPYTAEKFADLVERIRAARPGIAVTTDVIVGFPGETDADYQATRDLCERVKFDNGFIFRYSKRRDTPAAEMDDSLQISEQVKEERNQDLLNVINHLAWPRYEALVGQQVEILCDGPSRTNEERLSGRTRTNKIVVFEGNLARHKGEIFNVNVTSTANFTLYGDAVLANQLAPYFIMQEFYDWLFRQSADHVGIPLKATGIVLGLLLILKHLWAWLRAEDAMRLAKEFPRSRTWGIAILFVDMLWSLFLVACMDMGEFYTWRHWITLLVPVSFVLIVIYVPEFLAVRALGTLLLLLAQPVLEAAFLRQPTSRLLLPVLAYAWIIAGMFMIGMPYLMRDAIDWLCKTSSRWKLATLGGVVYGAVMVAAAVLWY